jgi:hypothetical protein
MHFGTELRCRYLIEKGKVLRNLHSANGEIGSVLDSC